MKHISQKSIDQAISIIDNLDDDKLEQVFEKYALKQETLLAYLMMAPLEYENEKLEGLLIYYFCLISECFHQEGLNINEIKESQIEDHLDPYVEMLDDYFEFEEEEILESYLDQPHLYQFLRIEVSTEDEDGTRLDDETANQLFIVTISMVALMKNAISEH